MPWEKRGVTSLREEFVIKAEKKLATISQLCRDYNISRKTAYKWLNRYSEEGILGLNDRSKRPSYTPLRTRDNFVDLIISLREKFPAWGAKKLKQVLINEGCKDLPSLSTFNRILRQENKIFPSESDKRKPFIRFEREHPNELWQMDFKGFFSVPGSECHPLTILDDCSRYAISLKACASENETVVHKGLENAFRQYGLPSAMTMDNGSPWKGYPGQRLSSITVWLMRLGIKVSHSRPRHPQTQGKDERFHRSFKEEVLKYHNFQSLQDAQQHFDEWRELYNCVRPHEALNMVCPAQKYRVSERPYTEKLPPIEYLPGDEVKKVASNGDICFQSRRYHIGKPLRGEFVALRQIQDHEWDVYYVNSRLCRFRLKL